MWGCKSYHSEAGLEEIVTISALSSPIICLVLPSAVNTGSYPHLNELLLADSGIDDKDSIAILVGCNYYWSIVTGKLRRGEDRGPVAVSSKLGGCYQSHLYSSVVTHSCYYNCRL